MTIDAKAVIAIGGRGTRLKSISKEQPKPLYTIAGKSTFFRCCEQLARNGIKDLICTINYKYEDFEEPINLIQEEFSLNITTYKESTPLGECGALWNLKDNLSENFIFINGDIIFEIDIKKILIFHYRVDSNLTLISHTSSHKFDSDLLTASNGSLIDDIYIKGTKNHDKINAYLGNTGISIINKSLLNRINIPSSIDNSSILNYLAKEAKEIKERIYSYNTSEYIKDMGTPKRFNEIENDLKLGNVSKRCYTNKQICLFIDRDNTLIKCPKKSYITSNSELQYLKDNIKKIASISNKYNFVCLVTNQPQIAMGLITIKELDQINSEIINHCLTLGLKIDIIAFCPHHPHRGFNGELINLKKDCFCRKPNPGLLIEQSYLRNIDLKNSLLIGDCLNDKLAAENAKCNFKYVHDL